MFGKKVKYAMCFFAISIGLFCACCFQEEHIQLTEDQKASLEIICQNVDKWGIEYQGSGHSWPVNRVYISELDNGITLMTVGYLDPKGWSGMNFFWGVRTYAITDKIYSYKTDLSLEWSAFGVGIDLNSMSDDEVQAVIEQSYLKYCEENKQ